MDVCYTRGQHKIPGKYSCRPKIRSLTGRMKGIYVCTIPTPKPVVRRCRYQIPTPIPKKPRTPESPKTFIHLFSFNRCNDGAPQPDYVHLRHPASTTYARVFTLCVGSPTEKIAKPKGNLELLPSVVFFCPPVVRLIENDEKKRKSTAHDTWRAIPSIRGSGKNSFCSSDSPARNLCNGNGRETSLAR